MKHNCLIAAKSPVNKTHDNIKASYSKMQEPQVVVGASILLAHVYAKFKGEIHMPYIGISLVRGSGCLYKGNYFYDFFSGGSGILY